MIIITKTKAEAIKERKVLDKRINPNLQTIIVDYTKEFPRKSHFRYNHRFLPKEIKLRRKDKIYTDQQATKILSDYKKRKNKR